MLQNGSRRPENRRKWRSRAVARRSGLKGQFQKLFHVNKTVNDFEYNVQFRKEMTISQQKGRRVPIHTQAAHTQEKEVNKPIAEGHIEKLAEDAFVSPVVITNNSDGTVKISLNSIELNKDRIKHYATTATRRALRSNLNEDEW